jgi:hypothetical protein
LPFERGLRRAASSTCASLGRHHKREIKAVNRAISARRSENSFSMSINIRHFDDAFFTTSTAALKISG